MAKIHDSAPEPHRSLGELTSPDGQDEADITSQLAQAKKDKVNRILRFNNTSFSGVDIKVLVHNYRAPTVDHRGDLERTIGAYEKIIDMLTRLAQQIVPRISTQAAALKRSEISNLAYQIALEDFRQLVAQIQQVENEIKELGYFQFIGSGLSSRIVEAQTSPATLTRDLMANTNLLVELIASWKAEVKTLASRSKDLVATKVLAELQTISISTHREKNPVRAFSFVSPKGFVRGARTLAGTMIFTVFDRNVLFELLDITEFDGDHAARSSMKDQLPPLDATISFANELGALSRMTIYGLEFVSEGQSMSIEDIILEDVCHFVCRDIDPLTPVLNEDGEPYNVLLNNYNQTKWFTYIESMGTRASDLRGSEWDLDNSSKNPSVQRFLNRRNPYR